jgi:hypothetical protein
MKIKETFEYECCDRKPWIKVAYREWECTHCKQRWIGRRGLDSSGNWDWEYEKKNEDNKSNSSI